MNYKDLIVNNALKEKRNQLGVRQRDVADMIGFSSTNRISDWEKGQSIPNIINLFKLCGIYNSHPYELYPGLLEKVAQFNKAKELDFPKKQSASF